MKISKTQLRQIIKEELEYVGAGIEDMSEPPEDEPSSPSAEAMTILRPLHAMNEKFKSYLGTNQVPLEYDAIKQHLLELGLSRSEAGIYALYGAESHGAMEEATDTQLSRQRTDATYRAGQAKDSPKKSSKEARGREHKARRQYGKKLAQQGEIEEIAEPGYPKANKEKHADQGLPEEEPLLGARPKHDPLDLSPAGIRARRRLQGRGIKNYPLDK